MDMLSNEFCKLRRTHVPTVAIVIPLVSVVIGAGNYAANSDTLDAGWASYWSQTTLFYGMVFMVAGISILASAAWRVEHRGGNWNTLLTSSRSAASLVTAKLGVIVAMTALMQCIFIITSVVGGWVSGLSGMPPLSLLAPALLAVVPAVAVAAWQSFASMVIRNFAMPVALGVLSSIIAFGANAAGATTTQFLLPPIGVSTTLWMGGTAVADSSAFEWSTISGVLTSTLLLTAVAWLASVVYLRRVDVKG